MSHMHKNRKILKKSLCVNESMWEQYSSFQTSGSQEQRAAVSHVRLCPWGWCNLALGAWQHVFNQQIFTDSATGSKES